MLYFQGGAAKTWGVRDIGYPSAVDPMEVVSDLQAIQVQVMYGQALGGLGFFRTDVGNPIFLWLDSTYVISAYAAEVGYVNAQYQLAVTAYLSLTDGFTMQDAQTNAQIARNSLAEALLFTDTDTFRGILRNALTENVTFADTTSNKTKYVLVFVETLRVNDIASSNNGIIAYVVNANTNAVSTYDNYTFNSVAKIDGVYYGLDSSGLHQLTGSTDNGSIINASVQTGAMPLETDTVSIDSMKTVAAVYLGGRAEGDLQVDLTANGVTNTYTLAATPVQELQGSRVLAGRGVAARYWTLRVSTPAGGSIEIESVVLLVDGLTRRVQR